MKLIVGLGNPGEKYEKTRHNLGFMVVESFLQKFEDVKNTTWDDSKKLKSDVKEIDWEPQVPSKKMERVILAKPKTFMNNSGMAVSLIANFYKIKPEDIWIINDEADLPLGSIKIRFGGASAGHKGVESVMESLGTDKFWRFRMGIGEEKHGLHVHEQKSGIDDFVLGKFTGPEHAKIKESIKRAVKAIEEALENSLESAQNQYNTK